MRSKWNWNQIWSTCFRYQKQIDPIFVIVIVFVFIDAQFELEHGMRWKLQTAEKLRGHVRLRRFLDGFDRDGAGYHFPDFRTSSPKLPQQSAAAILHHAPRRPLLQQFEGLPANRHSNFLSRASGTSARLCSARLGAAWHGSAQFGSVWFGGGGQGRRVWKSPKKGCETHSVPLDSGSALHSPAQLSSAWLRLAWLGSARCDPAQLCSVRPGSANSEELQRLKKMSWFP